MSIQSLKHKKTHLRECFHEDEKCSTKIIRAHSIQNNRILNKISSDGMVYYPFCDAELNISLKKKGRKSTSTFTGFCGFHDNFIFRSIDTKEYIKGNQEQEFLFAYRALAKEYHAKKEDLNRYRLEYDLKNVDAESMDLNDYIKFHNNSTREAITQTVLDGLSMVKDIFHSSLNQNNYNVIYTRTFVFYEEHHLAACSVLTPHKDLSGKIINDFDKIDEDINFYRFIYLTIFPQQGKTYVLLSFLKKHRKYLSPLLTQIQQCSKQKQKIIFSNLLAINTENLAISPKVWEGLPESIRLNFIEVFKKTAFAEENSMLSLENINLFV